VGCGAVIAFLAARFVISFTLKNPKLLLLLLASASCFLD
jgi:hypothetical protein